jgi:hypothetical protein
MNSMEDRRRNRGSRPWIFKTRGNPGSRPWTFDVCEYQLRGLSHDSNQDVGGPFHHLGCFLSLTALMIQFISLIGSVLSSYLTMNNGFISCWLFASLVSTAKKLWASVIAETNCLPRWCRPSGWCGRKTDSIISLCLGLGYILYFSAGPFHISCLPIL